MAEGSQEGLKLFGFEIKRAKDKSDEKRPSIVPPRDDEGGSYATASGTHYGQYLNLDGDDSKDNYQLIMKYRGNAMHPEVDAAIEDIVNEAITGSELEQTLDINLDNVDVPDKIKKIQLNDQYTLKLKYPMYSHMTKADLSENASASENLYYLTLGCLDSLQSEEEHFSFKDETKKDTEDFLDSLTSEQFNEIMEFVNSVPSLTHDIEFTCTTCNKDNTYTLRGINDFF